MVLNLVSAYSIEVNTTYSLCCAVFISLVSTSRIFTTSILIDTGDILIDFDSSLVKIASLKDGVDECIKVSINQLKVWYPEVKKNAR